MGLDLANVRSKRMLVTGASGHIGSAIARAAAAAGCSLRLTSRRPPPLPVDVLGDVEFVARDLLDPAPLDHLVEGIEIILHLAGSTRRARTPSEIAADSDINTRAASSLLDAAARSGMVPTVVLAGSETQHGIVTHLPIADTAPDAPLTPYDAHKCLAEYYLRAKILDGTVRGVSLRLPTVYGPGPAVGAKDRGVIALMMRRALSGDPITVYGDGRYLRDFVYVEDVAAAFIAAAAAAARLDGQHYLVGTGIGHTVLEAAELIRACCMRHADRQVAIEHVAMPDGFSALDRRNAVVDASRFSRATGWTAATSLPAGLEHMVTAMLNDTAVTPGGTANAQSFAAGRAAPL